MPKYLIITGTDSLIGRCLDNFWMKHNITYLSMFFVFMSTLLILGSDQQPILWAEMRVFYIVHNIQIFDHEKVPSLRQFP